MPTFISRRFFIAATVAILALGAVAPGLANADESLPLIVAHRGASHDAPENTLPAFQLAWEQGADCIEGDFYLSSDGKIVCIHDKTTKRTSGVDVNVSKTTLADLQKLDVGLWKDPKWRGTRIPTIEEVLAIVPPGKTILIEIKCGPEIVPVLKNVLANSVLKPTQTAVISFNKNVIAASKQQIPGIKAYWLTGYKKNALGQLRPTRTSVLQTLKKIGADGLDTQSNVKVVNEEFVRSLRDAGQEFHAWTIDDPKVAARFTALGVDSLTTNRPAFIRQHLEATQ